MEELNIILGTRFETSISDDDTGGDAIVYRARVHRGHDEIGISTVVLPGDVLAAHGTDVQRLRDTLAIGAVFGFAVEATWDETTEEFRVSRIKGLLRNGIIYRSRIEDRPGGGFLVGDPRGFLDDTAVYLDANTVNIVTDEHEGHATVDIRSLDHLIDALIRLRDQSAKG